MTEGRDKRQFSRMREQFEAECRRCGSGESWHIVQTIDLSATGMCFGSRLPYDLGAQLEFKMRPPLGEGLLEVRGEVVRVESITGQLCEIAVSFTNMTASQEIQLDELHQFMMKEPKRPSAPEEKGQQSE